MAVAATSSCSAASFHVQPHAYFLLEDAEIDAAAGGRNIVEFYSRSFDPTTLPSIQPEFIRVRDAMLQTMEEHGAQPLSRLSPSALHTASDVIKWVRQRNPDPFVTWKSIEKLEPVLKAAIIFRYGMPSKQDPPIQLTHRKNMPDGKMKNILMYNLVLPSLAPTSILETSHASAIAFGSNSNSSVLPSTASEINFNSPPTFSSSSSAAAAAAVSVSASDSSRLSESQLAWAKQAKYKLAVQVLIKRVHRIRRERDKTRTKYDVIQVESCSKQGYLEYMQQRLSLSQTTLQEAYEAAERRCIMQQQQTQQQIMGVETKYKSLEADKEEKIQELTRTVNQLQKKLKAAEAQAARKRRRPSEELFSPPHPSAATRPRTQMWKGEVEYDSDGEAVAVFAPFTSSTKTL